MTAPAPAASDPRLVAVAAWDVPRVRQAVAALSDVSARLGSWRARLDGLGRALESGECWSGRAARSAVASVEELSAASWTVDTALRRSLDDFLRLTSRAAAAQESAEVALAAGTGPDPVLPGLGRLAGALGDLTDGATWTTGPATAALEHATATVLAAQEAGAALAGLGVRDAFAPAAFTDLLTSVAPVAMPDIPAGRAPVDIAAWWAGLSSAAQEKAIGSLPAVIGALDGVPAWARDRANRLLLGRALADPDIPEGAAATARAVAGRIDAEEKAGREVQLHLLDLAGDRVAVALGDLDTADAVALVVPGIFNTPADDLSGLMGDAADLDEATRAAGPAGSVATMVWLGYRTPSNLLAAAVRSSADRGGPALAGALDGLAVARRAVAGQPARTTVVAHSYGTYVVDEAADEPGALAADAVVLLGSPGMEDDAASLEAPAVFSAATPGDPVTWANWFGDRHPWEPGYGSTALPTDASEGHSGYLDPGHPTLAAVGEVVAGTRLPKK